MSNPYDTLTGIPVASQAFVNSILGPVMVGLAVNLLTYGVAFTLFCSYVSSSSFKKDSRTLKGLTIVVMLLATIQSALSFEGMYHYSTWQIRDSTTLFTQTAADCWFTTPVGFQGALVQGFLAVRAAALFKKTLYKILFYVGVGIGIIIGLVGALGYLALSFQLRAGTYTGNGLNFSVTVGCWLWGCCVVDIAVTTALIVLLQQRVMGEHESTDSMIRRIMQSALESAIAPTFLALMGAILSYAFAPDSLDSNSSGAFWLPLSSFYAISLLVTLGSRSKLRRQAIASGVRGLTNDDGNKSATASRLGAMSYVSAAYPNSISRPGISPRVSMFEPKDERRLSMRERKQDYDDKEEDEFRGRKSAAPSSRAPSVAVHDFESEDAHIRDPSLERSAEKAVHRRSGGTTGTGRSSRSHSRGASGDLSPRSQPAPTLAPTVLPPNVPLINPPPLAALPLAVLPLTNPVQHRRLEAFMTERRDSRFVPRRKSEVDGYRDESFEV